MTSSMPASFNLCSASRQFSTAVLTSPSSSDSNSETGRLEVRRLTESHGEANEPVKGHEAECYWGELTDLGRTSTLVLGQTLRKLYVDQLGFIDPVLAPSQVRWRSTGMPRTIESLHQIAEGLFPSSVEMPDGHTRPARQGPIEYVVRAPEEESLYPNTMCARLRKLDEQSAAQVAKRWNPTLAAFDATIGKYLDGPLRVDGRPRANGVLDTVAAAKAHNLPVPPEFEDEKMLEQLERVIVHEWFDGYETSDEFKRLAMGRLLGDLRHHLERSVIPSSSSSSSTGAAAPAPPPARLSVYACHDTSVGGIANALGFFDGRWPPFTSHVAVELLQSSTTKTSPSTTLSSLFKRAAVRSDEDEYYVRVRYNAENARIPECQPAGKHLAGTDGTVCTWSAFKEAVAKVEMTAREWEDRCKLPGHTTPFASKIG